MTFTWCTQGYLILPLHLHLLLLCFSRLPEHVRIVAAASSSRQLILGVCSCISFFRPGRCDCYMRVRVSLCWTGSWDKCLSSFSFDAHGLTVQVITFYTWKPLVLMQARPRALSCFLQCSWCIWQTTIDSSAGMGQFKLWKPSFCSLNRYPFLSSGWPKEFHDLIFFIFKQVFHSNPCMSCSTFLGACDTNKKDLCHGENKLRSLFNYCSAL